MLKERRKKRFMGTPFERNILMIVYFSVIIPVIIAIFSLYFFIFRIIIYKQGISEIILMKLLSFVRQTSFGLIAITFLMLFILTKITIKLTHRISGPLYRLDKEISERFIFDKKAPISLRKKDELKSLVEKINKMLESKSH